MDLDLRVEDHDDPAVVHVGGEVDLATCPQLRDVLANMVDRGVLHLVVDLEQVGFLDSSGIGVLVSVLRRVRDRGGSVRLVAPGAHVRRVLELTGVTTLLPIYTTLSEAVAADPLAPRGVSAE